MDTAIIYTTIFLISLLSFYIAHNVINRNKYYLLHLTFKLIPFLLLWGLAAIRYNVGTDYKIYSDIYNGFYDRKFELSFNLLIEGLNYLNLPAQSFFVVTSFIILLFIFRGIEKSGKYKTIILFLFLASGSYFRSLNIIRSSMAAALFFISLKYIINRNFLKYTILIIIGTTLHFSMIIVFPIYFIVHKNYKNIVYWIGIALIPIFYFIISIKDYINYIILITPDEYAFYLKDDTYGNNMKVGLGMSLIYTYILGIIMVIAKKKIELKNKNYHIIFNLFYLWYFLSFIFIQVRIFGRINTYFELFAIVAISYLIDAFDKKSRIWIVLLIIIPYILFIVKKLMIGKYGVVPYQTFF